MNKKTMNITTGAMATAIFGVMLFLNRQTGGLFQDVFLILYPVPMVAYSAMYGWKNGIPALAAMSLISFLMGSFTTIFYAVTQAAIGLVFGSCLHHKVDMTKILLTVMILSAVVSVLNTVVLGFLFGININQEIAEVQNMMNTMFEKAGVVIPEQILSTNYLRQLFVISMILMGMVQGFIVYEVSLLLLRRLRFPVQKPKSIFLYYPPKWTGYAAMAAFFFYNAGMMKPFGDELLQNIALTVGTLGYLYLICFGFIAILLFLKSSFPKLKAGAYVICVLGIFIFPTIEMVAGFFYIATKYHEDMVKLLAR